MKKITFMDTSLRDAHQSLWNGQMTTAMMLPIASEIDKVGFEASDFMALISEKDCTYVRVAKDDFLLTLQ